MVPYEMTQIMVPHAMTEIIVSYTMVPLVELNVPYHMAPCKVQIIIVL
jgi:hypothetical protein